MERAVANGANGARRGDDFAIAEAAVKEDRRKPGRNGARPAAAGVPQKRRSSVAGSGRLIQGSVVAEIDDDLMVVGI